MFQSLRAPLYDVQLIGRGTGEITCWLSPALFQDLANITIELCRTLHCGTWFFPSLIPEFDCIEKYLLSAAKLQHLIWTDFWRCLMKLNDNCFYHDCGKRVIFTQWIIKPLWQMSFHAIISSFGGISPGLSEEGTAAWQEVETCCVQRENSHRLTESNLITACSPINVVWFCSLQTFLSSQLMASKKVQRLALNTKGAAQRNLR